ncbi:hypothetical protein O181_009810 [Austropuccinia psidii MF-1]|uniref:Uncharacterized protein n=1 Tax=Austropuccinia psidii MF-1 TaxID=1389203 RepID=A0A9Q3GK98_9BASI|nr:hypothetical protein [Austropuccinia psidii MF-1]
MSDDRFNYIHLRSETSLWCYVDDQIDWSIESLDDRVEQSIWDMIPPYQNEDDEGILPSHAHPSYPFGNPYDPSHTNTNGPQLIQTTNQPLAVGSSLLLENSNIDLTQSHWPELATDRLLWTFDSHLSNSAENSHPEDLGSDPIEPQQTADHTHQRHAPTQQRNGDLQAQMRTPATEEYPMNAGRGPDGNETEESDWDEEEPMGEDANLAAGQSIRSE